MAKLQRTVRMTIAVTFRAYDMDDPQDAPHYESETLEAVVGYWIERALYDRNDSPELTVILSKLERKMVD